MINIDLKDNVRTRSHKLYVLLVSIVTFILLIKIRAHAIACYGVELPFWDQWDGEVLRLYYTFLDGNLGIKDFFLPANEHRIFYTRVLNLLVFIYNDNTLSCLDVMYVQNWVMCFSISILIFLINLDKFRWLPSMFLFVVYSLPMCWENQFWGNQSQFYFLILFLILGLWYAASEEVSVLLVSLFSVLAVASMGTAFLIPVIASFHCFIRWALNIKNKIWMYKGIWFLLLGGILTQVIWHNPAHKELRANSFNQFFEGLKEYLCWPGMPFPFIGFISLCLFILLLGIKLFRNENWTKLEVFSCMFIFFVYAIGVMGSFARVGGIAIRYHDYLLLGLFGMVLFATCQFERKNKHYFEKIIRLSSFGIVIIVMTSVMSLAHITGIQAWQRNQAFKHARGIILTALSIKSQGAEVVKDYLLKQPVIVFPDHILLAEIISNPHANQVFKNYR